MLQGETRVLYLTDLQPLAPAGVDTSLVFAGDCVGVKLALSMLCENPVRKTGLTTLYHELVSHSLPLSPDVSWIVFVGPAQEWQVKDDRVQVIRKFPANDRLVPRLLADHLRVPACARSLGADALITTGFVPLRKSLPVVMHVLSLQHLSPANRVGLARGLYRNWVMSRWPKADLMITNSKFAVSQILGAFPQLSSRLVQSYEGLQHDQFVPNGPADEAKRLRQKFGVQPGYFLWISNFYAYKQAELLIDAYALLGPEQRKRHPLVMVGGSWERRLEAAQEQAARLGISGDVRFPGWVDDADLAPLYRHAIAFCLASREETFGRCVIEAMACGTPCVVNDIPIMREVTAGCALLVDFKQPRQVANALARAAEDGALHKKLRECGIAHAQNFSFDRLARERIEAIRKTIKRSNVRASG
jgi:glycosyltransferase involved in cell wall biosynthesis